MRFILLGLLAWIPFCGQPLRGQSPHNPEHQIQFSTLQTKDDKRGTNESPLVIEMFSRPQGKAEATKEV
jgi:hypothetical protein